MSGEGLSISQSITQEKKGVVFPTFLSSPENATDITHQFKREQGIPQQVQFGEQVKNEILVPVRAELANGNLANYLRQLNEQKGFNNQDKIGVVLLINDNASDHDKRKDVLDENHLTAQYLSLLTTGEMDDIDQLSIAQEYKDLAKQIREKDHLEIRFDFLHYKDSKPHFGALRVQLFKLAEAFKNPNISEKDVVVHLSDIDTSFSPSYFQNLKAFYKDPSHGTNFAEKDFMPGVHEGEKEEDLSKDLLTYLDEYRLYRYGADIEALLGDKITSGTPTISGRLSYFFEKGQLNSEIDDIGNKYHVNEDYAIGKYIREKNKIKSDEKAGNIGEVYSQHRLRSMPFYLGATTDAEEAFQVIKGIHMDHDSGYLTQEYADKMISNIEAKVFQAQNRFRGEGDNLERFQDNGEYKKILKEEITKEKAKVRLRRMRLMDHVDSLAGNKEVPSREQKVLDPYIEYFQDETDDMKKRLSEGKTPEQVAVSYIGKYDSFFNPDTAIHTQIARLRALKKYIFAHELKSLTTPELDGAISEEFAEFFS